MIDKILHFIVTSSPRRLIFIAVGMVAVGVLLSFVLGG